MLDITTTITINRDQAPRVGDQMSLRSDVLAEIARHAPGLPPTWRFLPAGTTGKLLGWRGEARAVVEIEEPDYGNRRLVVFVKAERIAARADREQVPQLAGSACNRSRVR